MPIFRGLIIIIAIWLVFTILRQQFGKRRKAPTGSPSQKLSAYSDMVACQQCDVHIPKAEAITLDGRYYCSNTCIREFHENQK